MALRSFLVLRVLTAGLLALVATACFSSVESGPDNVHPPNATANDVNLSVSISPAGTGPYSAILSLPRGENVAPLATGIAYFKGDDDRLVVDEDARLAIDGDTETIWSSERQAPQWYSVVLDQSYLVDRVEMVITQAPPGPTTHEIWLGNGSGVRTLYRKLIDVHTEDGQSLYINLEPPHLADEVRILTTHSPSWVGWRELRVFGSKPPVPTSNPTAPRFEVKKVMTGLEFPVQVTHAGDGSGRIFVVEQQGRIQIIENGKINAQPFLDISDRVSCCAEQGMFTVAFPPTYADERILFVSYTDLAGDTVISRFTSGGDPERVKLQSEETILILPQAGNIHNGGHLAFGPRDGLLYIGSGDGGIWYENTGQNTSSLLGKILRIDVIGTQQSYDVPAGNPFTSEDDYRDEIWAVGLRNPWGFAFDKESADLFIPDTGNSRREEVNFQPATSQGGENYGWPLREGTICFEFWQCSQAAIVLQSPVAEYDRSQGCAVVGGVVYRGKFNRDMKGLFLFADFCSGRIWGLKRPEPIYNKEWKSMLLAKAPVPVSSVGEDEEGNVYVTGYQDGALYLLEEK